VGKRGGCCQSPPFAPLSYACSQPFCLAQPLSKLLPSAQSPIVLPITFPHLLFLIVAYLANKEKNQKNQKSKLI